MKKALFMALAVLPVLFACSKNNSSTDTSTLEPPKNAKEAKKVVVKEEIKITTSDKKELSLKEINFMRSGRYVAVAEILLKASNEIVLTGTYTVSNGNYTVTGDINATISTTSDSITYTDTASGEEQTSTATVTPSNVQEGSAQDKAYRTWKLQGDSNAIILEFQSLGGKAKYANISNLVNDLVNHEITIDQQKKEKLLGYDIVDISLDNNEIVINFSKANPFKGSFILSDNLTFTYDLSAFMTGDVFQAKANGSIAFEGNKAVITMNVESSIEKLGNGTATITLVAVN
ncbi:MAG: hypothetical protein J6P56_04385 [Bacteroidales bacterium]|nr:hypothetical protein [Bacteroidales bacterium]